MGNTQQNIQNKWLVYGGLLVVVGLLPILFAGGMLYAVQGIFLWDLLPGGADEVLYWHQAATFRAVGLGGGYYTNYEQPAPASFTPFYAWGPFVPAFYGGIGRVIGWWGYSGVVLVNLAFVSLMWWWLLGIIRPSLKVLGLLTIVLITFPPFLMYSVRSLTELQHHAIAIGLAAGFSVMLNQGITRRRVVVLAFAILAAALLRLTWALMLLPLGLLVARRWWHVLAAGGITLAALLPLTLFIGYIAAPYEDFLTGLFNAAAVSYAEAWAVLWEHMGRNWWAGIMGAPVERSIFLQFLVITLVFVGVLIYTRFRWDNLDTREAWFHIGSLTSIFALIYIAYDTFDLRGLRTLSPHLLVSLLVIALRGRARLVIGLAALSLMVFPQVLGLHRDWSSERILTAERLDIIQAERAKLGAFLQYNPEADSAWCNTLIINVFFLEAIPSTALAIEPGIGLTNLSGGIDLDNLHNMENYRLRAKYIFWAGVAGPFPDRSLALQPLIGDEVRYFDEGYLDGWYINQESQCPQETAIPFNSNGVR